MQNKKLRQCLINTMEPNDLGKYIYDYYEGFKNALELGIMKLGIFRQLTSFFNY